MNGTQMIRNYAAVNGLVRKKEVRDALGMEEDMVTRGFQTLMRQECLEVVERGLYRFVENINKPIPEATDKVWRAMRMSQAFSASEIAMLAGTSVDYVYKRFRIYRAEGYIKPAGVRPAGASGRTKLWRLTATGKKRAQNPSAETFTPDALTMAAVNLNRLICSGLVARDKGAADQACALAEEIKAFIADLDIEG